MPLACAEGTGGHQNAEWSASQSAGRPHQGTGHHLSHHNDYGPQGTDYMPEILLSATLSKHLAMFLTPFHR